MIAKWIPIDAPEVLRWCGPGADPATSSASAMSIDQAMLDHALPDDPPTFRIYTWPQPTLSLGYFQSRDDRHSHHGSGDLPMVRRASGGGAIVHHLEWTYCMILPTRSQGPLRRDPTLGYRWIHGAIVETLGGQGIRVQPFRELDSGSTTSNQPESDASGPDPFLCFRRRTDEDLILSGYKVVGSAQRRGRHAWMQHGSVLWSVSPHAEELPGIEELSSTSPDRQRFADDLQQVLARILGVTWKAADLSPQESGGVALLNRERFASADWTNRR